MYEIHTLDATRLCFDYDDMPVLRNITFRLEAGQILHIRGHNGAGKSTLLRMLTGILRPDAGDIAMNGTSVFRDIPGWQQQFCYLGHRNGISSLLTPREHVLTQPRVPANPDPDMSAFREQWCGTLSAGQRRKVALISVLAEDKPVWLLDEPFTALDQDGIRMLAAWMQAHRERGGMMVLASHQPVPLEGVLEYAL